MFRLSNRRNAAHLVALMTTKPRACPHCGGTLGFHGRTGNDDALFVCVECDRSTVDTRYRVDAFGVLHIRGEQE